MEPLIGYKIDRFPLPDLEYFSDLIYFEGPLLVHYIQRSNKHNYFYQWADTDGELNRWLVYRVEHQKVLDYIRGLEDLTSVLLSTSSDYIIVVDIDAEDVHQNVQMLHLEALPQDYISSEGSTYDLAIPSQYHEWLLKERTAPPNGLGTFYDVLRGDAIYMNVRPNDLKHGTTVAVPEIVDFLDKFNESYINFAEIDFERSFGGIIDDPKKMKRLVKQVRQVSTLRAADVGPGSFGVALAPDFISAMGDTDPIIHEWLRTLISRFQQEVVNIDFSDPAQLGQLEERYTPEQRAKFLNPYIKILENSKYSFAKADKNFKPTKKSARIVPSSKEKLLVEVPKELANPQAESSPEREVVTLVVEKNKGQDISKMSGKQIASGTLFSQQMPQFPVQLTEVEFRGKKIKLREPVTLIAKKVQDSYIIDDSVFGVSGEGETAESALALLKERIFRLYQRLADMTINNMTEAQVTDFNKLKDYLLVE